MIVECKDDPPANPTCPMVPVERRAAAHVALSGVAPQRSPANGWCDCHQQLLRELAERSLRVRPHIWLAEDWFSPRGIPGIAIPFYLAHPRLMRLERAQMHSVEGGAPASCMAIMRHEAGHAIQHAHRLHRRTGMARDSSAHRAPPIPIAIGRIGAAPASFDIFRAGTRRVIPMRILRRRSPCGCALARVGAHATPSGPSRSQSSRTSIR